MYLKTASERSREVMASFILLLVLSCLPSLLALPLEKRDDNIPARVPYIFPEAGTDSVRTRRLWLYGLTTTHSSQMLFGRDGPTENYST